MRSISPTIHSHALDHRRTPAAAVPLLESVMRKMIPLHAKWWSCREARPRVEGSRDHRNLCDRSHRSQSCLSQHSRNDQLTSLKTVRHSCLPHPAVEVVGRRAKSTTDDLRRSWSALSRLTLRRRVQPLLILLLQYLLAHHPLHSLVTILCKRF